MSTVMAKHDDETALWRIAFWLARNEGMDKKMETTVVPGYIGTTISNQDPFPIPS